MGITPILQGFIAYGFAAILLPIALLIPPTVLSHAQLAALFLPFIFIADVYSFKCGCGPLGVMQLFWATDLLVFRDPRAQFRVMHRRTPGKNDGDRKVGDCWKEGYPVKIGQRISWVWKIVWSLRFIGVDTGRGGLIPEIGKVSRGRWLARKAGIVALCILVLDSTTSWTLFDPYFLRQGSIDSALPSFVPFYDFFSLSPRLCRETLMAIQQAAALEITGAMPAFILVSLGGLGIVGDWWGNHNHWPPVMGDPRAMYRGGLRGFWGSSWHQMFRSIFTDPGKALSRTLNLQKSTAGYLIVTVTAFLISSIFHGFTYPPSTPDINPARYASFFWLHALFVMLEVLVSRATKGIGPEWLRTFVRIAWCFVVFYFTIPLIGSELVKFMVSVERPTMLFPMPKA